MLFAKIVLTALVVVVVAVVAYPVANLLNTLIAPIQNMFWNLVNNRARKTSNDFAYPMADKQSKRQRARWSK